MAKLSPMMEQYFRIKEQHKDTKLPSVSRWRTPGLPRAWSSGR